METERPPEVSPGASGPGPRASGPGRFSSCGCFFTDNIFLSRYKLHLRCPEPGRLERDWGPLLRSKGCVTEEDFRNAQAQVVEEIQRRKQLGRQSLERIAIISKEYKPLRPEVYILQETFLAPEFLDVVAYSKSSAANVDGLLSRVQTLPASGVYSFPVFTDEFCGRLIEELEHFESSDMPKGRPNTMNNYGVLLNELGFDESLVTPLREVYLQPIARLLYPDSGGGSLDTHKAFVVKYSLNQDLELSFHYDNAEVTLNVCLGKDFSGGNLYFGDMRQVPLSESECTEIEHRVGRGLLHRGQHCHGALPITHGERCNLIVWMRSSQVRNQLCPMCNKKPQLVEAVGFGDGFTCDSAPDVHTVDVCSLN
ncbi:2-oxoglutarate and iron-dependent oxygenase domain-containing protein 2 [Callorhinchus milii]|uniref:2-oxoglutarate and iron-dependent oxygenase domain-containing protein 2 n=1 Tax=Callorhinchus milii TaxID=7868 RepID=UPI001C3F73F0|nr:2-oxoglutarate and iron-dependent oxygenase domain-containing protein 2 [Callorhinchus milii]